jgi:hypothetical protein
MIAVLSLSEAQLSQSRGAFSIMCQPSFCHWKGLRIFLC